ncbi:MAG: AEC family transporter [Clostridia bacterium]|nr:AEC family transporter [Clostridia bacterium]
MNVAPSIIYNVALLFIMMVPGIIMKKCKLCSDTFGKGLSNLVLYIAQPALVFLAYVRPYDGEILKNSLWVFIFSVVAHLIFAAAALTVFKKAPDAMRRMLSYSTLFSNAAFMGIPLIAAVLEDLYPGATLYASIYNITFNLFLWSVGVYICTNGKDADSDGIDDHDEAIRSKKSSPLVALYHPVTVAALLGVVIFILPIEGYIPAIATEAFSMLKNLVAPLSMTVLGLRIADMKLAGAFKDKFMYLFLALRHIILPFAVILVLRAVELFGLSLAFPVKAVLVIMAAAPAASSGTMFAEKFDCDAVYVSRLVAISTILSIATMPLMVLFI